MLKFAWYLIPDTDYWSGICDFPRLPQAPELTATLDELFSDEADISPARTATAVEIMLRMAEQLSHAIPHGPFAVADREQFARLLHGLNLLLVYVAQISGRLAHQIDSATGADLSVLSAGDRAVLTTAVAAASCRLEESAGLFKEAHLATGSTARRTARQ